MTMMEASLQDQIIDLLNAIGQLNARLEVLENQNLMMSDIISRLLPPFPPQGKRHGNILFFDGDVATWTDIDNCRVEG